MLYLASDHAGFELKDHLVNYLKNRKIPVTDLGTYSLQSVDWPKYGAKAAQAVSNDPIESKGIIICGSGLGMSMVANKFPKVRAALCQDEYTAEMSRKHNNANVLNLGARIISKDQAEKIVSKWLSTEFEGGRHQERLDILNNIEIKNFNNGAFNKYWKETRKKFGFNILPTHNSYRSCLKLLKQNL